MDNKDLLNQQKSLQNEAKKIMDELNLQNIIEPHGQLHIVGSVALGLMTWRDLDLEIIVPVLNKQIISQVCADLTLIELPRIDFTLMDNLLKKDPRLPSSLYIGIKYHSPKTDNDWKIDLHFITDQDSRSLKNTQEIKSKLNDENTIAILRIKNEIASNPKYRKEIFSMDIYNAVLDHNISDLEGFRKYLTEIGKEL